MLINLLNDICIDCHYYRSNAGWCVNTNIPRRLLKQTITVIFVCPGMGDDGQWVDTRKTLKVKASRDLDYILAPIMEFVFSIDEESNHFFRDNRLLVELVLDTETMEATTKWVG